jgi:glycerol-3-phosphate cytidylyltransferase/D-beta-D-heptose 7-phosphate kinase/D-beta-D-heptose 1-phosphate adenosyltransferase
MSQELEYEQFPTGKTVVIVSGHFNPIHAGHINHLCEAKKLGDILIVIINNDKQQILKKGKIIMSEDERMTVVKSIRYVDDIALANDNDPTVIKTIEALAILYKGNDLIFANGGDRKIEEDIPERDTCKKYGIKMLFGVGGFIKTFSSTEINKLRGAE